MRAAVLDRRKRRRIPDSRAIFHDPKQLGAVPALSGPLLTLLLDRVQDRGLIERVRNAADGRSQRVRLTAEGAAFVRGLAERTPVMESDLSGSLSAVQRAMLIELLDKVANHRDGAEG